MSGLCQRPGYQAELTMGQAETGFYVNQAVNHKRNLVVGGEASWHPYRFDQMKVIRGTVGGGNITDQPQE
jgi:hypothetical protein